MPASRPTVSILMATLNESEYARTLAELRDSISGIEHEFVVCTPFEAGGENVVWIPDPNPRGSTAAFNSAFAAARGNFIAITTEGKSFQPEWLSKSLDFIARRDDGRGPFAACMAMFNPFVGEKVIGTALGLLYPWLWTQRRESFAAMGGFLSTDLVAFCADLDFGFRVWHAGGKVAVVPDTHYVHRPEVVRLRPDMSAKKASDFDRLVQRWYPVYGAGFGEILPDGTMGIAPQNIAYDIPESFWGVFMRDDTILVSDRVGFPTWGYMLTWASHHAARLGVRIPGDVRRNPARVPAWLQSIGFDQKPLSR